MSSISQAFSYLPSHLILTSPRDKDSYDYPHIQRRKLNFRGANRLSQKCLHYETTVPGSSTCMYACVCIYMSVFHINTFFLSFLLVLFYSTVYIKLRNCFLCVIILYRLIHRMNIFPISATAQISDNFIFFQIHKPKCDEFVLHYKPLI